MICFFQEYGKSLEVLSIDPITYLSNLEGCGSLEQIKSNCFFYLTLTSENEQIAPNNYVFLDKLKSSKLAPVSVKIANVTQVDAGGNKFEIVVFGEGIAVFVWLDAGDVRGVFSENGFLKIGNNKTVYFETEESLTAAELKGKVTVIHLTHPSYYMT